MFIVGQSRKITVNVDNAATLDLDGKRIIASTNVGDVNLGVYSSDARAEEVYEDMLRNIFPPSVIVAKDVDISREVAKEVAKGTTLMCSEPAEVKVYECGAYYMPKE